MLSLAPRLRSFLSGHFPAADVVLLDTAPTVAGHATRLPVNEYAFDILVQWRRYRRKARRSQVS